MIYVFPSDEKTFNGNGMCTLTPSSCVVHETLNGEWELSMHHPIDMVGKWQYLLVGNVIKAPVPVSVAPRQIRNQPFRIYRIIPGLDQISVYARHLSYDLLDNMLYAYKPGNATPVDIAAQGIFNHCQSSHPFTIYSDITAPVDDLAFENTNPLEALMGESGLVDKSSGEIARDWFKFYLLKRVGQDTDLQIRQGKNLLGITYEVDDAGVVTRILPTGEMDDGKLLYLEEKYVDSEHINTYSHPRWIHLPVSEAKVSEELSEAQAKEKLRKAARDEFEKGCDLPDITLDVDFLNLADTLEYAEYRPLSHLFLGDSVRVIVKTLYLEVALRMTEYSFDCILKRYTKVTLGSVSETIAGSMISPRQLPAGGIKGIKLAMGSIGTGHIQFASIGSLQVKNAAIDTAHIKHAAISTAHIQDASIETAKIKDAQITSAKIDTAAIQTAHIIDAAISRAKIGLAAIGTAQIENAAITRAKIAEAAIGSAQIENAVIGTAHIKDAAITNAKVVSLDAGKISTGTLDAGKISVVNLNAANITTGKLTSAQIDAGAVTAAHIASKTITAAQLQAGLITATSGLLSNAAIDTAHIKDAAITNAKISTLSASKITTGTLDAAAAKIINVDAGSITVGKINGVQIANGSVDMQHLHQTGVVQVISKAQATADGKNKVFYRTTANKPTTADGLKVDDLWFDLSNGYRVNRWTGTQWEVTTLGPSALDLEIGGTNLITGTSAEFKDISVTVYTGTVQSNVMFEVLRLVVGEFITFRVYCKAINKPLRARISQYRADGTYDAVTGNLVPLGSEGFSSVTTKIGADKVKLSCLIQNGDTVNFTATTTEQYKWAKLERGNKPTDWSPSPGDVDELISNVRYTADGKNSVYYQATAPAGGIYINGDLWFDTSKGYRMSVRSGNVWTASAYSGEAIAASSITAGHIATGAITAGKIVAGAIETDKLAANAVTAAKVAANAITADKVSAGAITAVKIATGAINADKIAAGAIQAAAIQAGVIDATHIAANTITGNKLAIGTVSATYITDGAITTAKVLTNAITTDKINTGAVTANEIASNAVTTAKISAGAVTASQIATGAITAGKVAANAITAGNIAASAITTEKIATGAITADELATNAVTAVKVLASAITADKIASNAIIASKISAGAITTDKLGAGAVTAVKIASGAITTGHLAAAAVDASKIKAGSISVNHISANDQETLRLAAVNSLSIGAKNLLLDSGSQKTSTAYHIANYYLTEPWVVGQEYTVVIKGTINSGQRFGIWRDGGYAQFGYATYNADLKLWIIKATAVNTARPETNLLSVYNVASATATSALIDWIILVKGNKAPIDYVPPIGDPSAGRNLLLNSGRYISNSAYLIGTYNFGNLKPKHGEKITVSIKGQLGTGKQSFGVYNSGGMVRPVTLTPADRQADGVYRKSAYWIASYAASPPANTHINVYTLDSATVVTSTIEWIKLEIGDVSSPWSAAPEDPVAALKTSYIDIADDRINISSGGRVNINAGGELKLSGARVQIDASDANNSHINFGSVFNVGKDATGAFGLSINSPNDSAIRINGQPIWHKGNILVQRAQPAAGKGVLWLRPNSTQTVDYRYTIKSKNESSYYGGGTKIYTLGAATSDVMSVSGTYNVTVRFTLCNYGNPSYTFGTITMNLYKGNAQLTLTHAGTTLSGWVQREFTLNTTTTNTIYTSGTAGITCYIQIAGTKTALLDSFLSHVPGTAIECQITGPGGTSSATPCEVFWCP